MTRLNQKKTFAAPKTVLLAALLLVFALGFALGFASSFVTQNQKEGSANGVVCPAVQITAQPIIQKTAQPSVQPSAALTKLPEETLTATLRVLAVRGDSGEGAVGNVTAEIRLGKGRILVNTNPFVEPDTQYSAETAARFASAFSNKSIADRDIIFSFESPGQLVGGQSAGAAM
ncbi:MAG: hypothetical protein QW343_01010, partial [Candidatus Norongarragalinales archaeon]